MAVEQGTPSDILFRLRLAKRIARIAIGLVWIHEGLVPKLLFQQPYELSLVARVGIPWPPPELVLAFGGVLEIAVGIVLIFGWFERTAAAITSVMVLVLSAAALIIEPAAWYDPFQGVPKNLVFAACGLVVVLLSPLCPSGAGKPVPRQ